MSSVSMGVSSICSVKVINDNITFSITMVNISVYFGSHVRKGNNIDNCVMAPAVACFLPCFLSLRPYSMCLCVYIRHGLCQPLEHVVKPLIYHLITCFLALTRSDPPCTILNELTVLVCLLSSYVFFFPVLVSPTTLSHGPLKPLSSSASLSGKVEENWL